MNNKPYIVIMAGGIGSRFWPESRRRKPKQFLDILGTGRTLLQMTYDRFREVGDPSQFIIVTYKKYIQDIKEQLPEISDEQILSEPSRKNTATCIAYACYKIRSKDPEAKVIITPADHLIKEEKEFVSTLQHALTSAEIPNRLITIGIKPDRPETGYGYIQYIEKKQEEIFKVKTFTEKPDEKLAQTFLDSGDFVWNSGIFVWKAKSLIYALEKYLPDLSDVFSEGLSKLNTVDEAAFISSAYTQVKSISIDYGVMEKSDKVYVIPGYFGWCDLGSWASLHDLHKKDPNNNAIAANALLYETTNSFVKTDSDRLVVVQGLDNYLINESDNVLLICKLDAEKKFREFVADAKKKGLDFI